MNSGWTVAWVLVALTGRGIALDRVALMSSGAEYAMTPDTARVLMRVRYHEGGTIPSPCAEDGGMMVDTVYVRVRAGDHFVPRRWTDPYRYPGTCEVVSVSALGEVLVRLPDGVSAKPEQRDSLGEEVLLVTEDPVVASTPPANDGGYDLEFMVMSLLPSGAEVGTEIRARPMSAFENQRPVVVERRDPVAVPVDYVGPWGTVAVKVILSPAGDFDRAEIVHGISSVCDAAAISTVRRWKYRLGVPCRGFSQQRSMVVEVPFRAPKRAR